MTLNRAIFKADEISWKNPGQPPTFLADAFAAQFATAKMARLYWSMSVTAMTAEVRFRFSVQLDRDSSPRRR